MHSATACSSSIGIVGVSRLTFGAGMQDAVDLLHPLLTDTVDYVKQGALIATALVLMQQPESKVHCLHCILCHTVCKWLSMKDDQLHHASCCNAATEVLQPFCTA